MITVTKAVFLKLFSYRKTLWNIFVGGYILSVEIKYSHINHEPNNNIHSNSAKHNNKSLPCWLASEFPRLRRLRHLLLVHALVYHSRDFYVTAQRQPANSVNGFAYFLFEE